MKLILFFVISCLALHKGKSAVYKNVRCKPDGNQANCVIYQSPEIPWSADLPSKLPASEAENLETKPVQEEDEEDEEIEQVEEEEEEEEVQEDEEDEEDNEPQMTSEDRELPLVPEEGSGLYEGSGISEDSFMPEVASIAEMGSGESDTDPFRGEQEYTRVMRRLFPSKYLRDEAKPAEHEMKEDHLLQP